MEEYNWNTVCGAIHDLPSRNIWFSDNPAILLTVLTNICSCWFVVTYQLRSYMYSTRINLALMINAGMLLALKQEAHLKGPVIALGLTWKSLSPSCQGRANITYTLRPSFSFVTVTWMHVINIAQSHHKRWSILKSAEFGSSSSLPPLVDGGGGLACESVVKADLLSDHFDCKQSSEAVDLALAGHPSLSLFTFAIRLSEVRRLLLDNSTHMVALTQLVCFLLF